MSDAYDPAAIRRLRTSRQLTQEAFAQSLAVSLSTIRRWERGHITPNRLGQRALAAWAERTHPHQGSAAGRTTAAKYALIAFRCAGCGSDVAQRDLVIELRHHHGGNECGPVMWQGRQDRSARQLALRQLRKEMQP